MMKVNSWIRCEAADGGCYTIDRDGDPREIIDMAISTTKMELWDNLQLMRYAKVQTRRMFRDLWRSSDGHTKLMYALSVCWWYAKGVCVFIVATMIAGWCITAVERLVVG